ILASNEESLGKAMTAANAENASFRTDFDTLYSTASDDGKRRLDKIKTAYDRRSSIQNETFQEAKKNSAEHALALVSGEGLNTYRQMKGTQSQIKDAIGEGPGAVQAAELSAEIEETRGAIKGLISSNTIEDIKAAAKD